MERDEEALAAFCEREHPVLVRALTLYTADPQLAADLASEALTRAIARWPHVQQLGSHRAWLYRVGMNLAHSWFRRRAAEQRALRRHGSQIEDADPEVWEAVDVRRALMALSSRHRRVLVLRYYLDWSVDETALALRVSPAAVASLTYRAAGALRAQLAGSHTEAEYGH